jgi:hypothetical protein
MKNARFSVLLSNPFSKKFFGTSSCFALCFFVERLLFAGSLSAPPREKNSGNAHSSPLTCDGREGLVFPF